MDADTDEDKGTDTNKDKINRWTDGQTDSSSPLDLRLAPGGSHALEKPESSGVLRGILLPKVVLWSTHAITSNPRAAHPAILPAAFVAEPCNQFRVGSEVMRFYGTPWPSGLGETVSPPAL